MGIFYSKIKIPFCVVFIIYIFSNLKAFGQNYQRQFDKGEKYFKIGNFVKAKEYFLPLAEVHWNENEVCEYLANCYFELHEPKEVIGLIAQISTPSNQNMYDIAKAYYYLEDFTQSKKLLTQVDTMKIEDQSALSKKIVVSTKNYDESKGFVIQNFGSKINSRHREYSTVMYNDYNSLLFTSRRLKEDGLSYETIYSTKIDSANNWQGAELLNMKIENDKMHDATVQVYGEGKKMVLYHDGQLFTSVLEDGVWKSGEPLNIHNYMGSDTHCFITNDEKTIYFASDLGTDGHDLDLFYSFKDKNGNWTEPEPMQVFNTEYDEDAPFLADDGTFYFSSRGHDSMGGYDVFKSTKNEAGQWSNPINLGHPINTVAEDIYYTMEGKLGYISSTRNGGFGSLDLYRVFLFNNVKIQGQVLDEKSNEPMVGVIVDLEYDSSYLRSYTDILGMYEMFVPINSEIKVTFTKDTTKLHEGKYIVNVFFKDKSNNEFNFAISNELKEPSTKADLILNENVKEIRIDVKNDFSNDPLIASISRNQRTQWTDSLNRSYKEIKPVIEKVILEDILPQKTSLIISFDTNSYKLDYNAKQLLSNLCSDALNRNEMTIEINGYTDINGMVKNNAKLSVLRAKSVFDYLKNKDISVERMQVKGLGSTSLIDNTNNEQAHRRNRRVEIIYYY